MKKIFSLFIACVSLLTARAEQTVTVTGVTRLPGAVQINVFLHDLDGAGFFVLDIAKSTDNKIWYNNYMRELGILQGNHSISIVLPTDKDNEFFSFSLLEFMPWGEM